MAFSKGHALIIGIGTYKYAPQLDVLITTCDAKEVAEVLRDENYCGYPPDQVILLHDANATRDRIMQELEELAKKLKPDDTLFLFYSGHGMYGYAEDESYYLTTHDSKVEKEEKVQRVIDNSGISEREIIDAINLIMAKRIFLFFNACHSGVLVSGALDGSQRQDFQGTKPLPDRLSTLLGSGEGRVTITACREYELSSFLEEAKLTFFGCALIEGLRGNKDIPIENGCITISDLYSYIHRKVKAAAERVNKCQEPKMFNIVVGSLPVALHSGSIFKEIINRFSSSFKRTVIIHIETMNLYKEVYSLLHRVQSECYNSMLRDVKRIEKQKDSFEDLDIFSDIQSYLNSLNYIYKELQHLASNKTINSEIEEWLEHINKANQELEISISKKDLNSFKKANWYIEQVMNDETQATNNLFIKIVKIILENLCVEELELMIGKQTNFQINSEMMRCISNLLEAKKSMCIYIDVCNVLSKIVKRLLNHRGELENSELAKLFINQIKENINLLESYKTSNQLNELSLVLSDWKTIEINRESQKLTSLLSNIKTVFFKINQSLIKHGDELMTNEDKLLSLNNLMEK